MIELNRKSREKNPEYHKNYQKDYRQRPSSKEKQRIYNQNRRQKNHDIADSEWENCKDYFNHECAYCGFPVEKHYQMYAGELRKTDLHKEHAIYNGADDLSNCIPSCQDCNSRKWEYDLDEWYNENNEKFSIEKYNKIRKWLDEDYKKYKQ